jgi:hypothetical protein
VSDASLDLTNSTTLLTIFSSVPDADKAQMSTITAGLVRLITHTHKVQHKPFYAIRIPSAEIMIHILLCAVF